MHRDVKLENIMVTDAAGALVAKLIGLPLQRTAPLHGVYTRPCTCFLVCCRLDFGYARPMSFNGMSTRCGTKVR